MHVNIVCQALKNLLIFGDLILTNPRNLKNFGYAIKDSIKYEAAKI